MTNYIRRHKWKTFIFILLILTPVLVWAGADHLRQGADAQSNVLQGDVTYNRPSCFVSATTDWDVVDCGPAGGLAVDIVGPLGTQAEATSVATTPPTDAYYMVSRTAAANAVTNPLWFQISQDGTNAVDATHPIPISDDLAANAVTNPIFIQVSQDGTNAVDATHPIPISDDLNANAVTNPIFTQLSQDGTNAVDATHPVYTQISQDGTNLVDATHPLPVSDDLSANAINNPMFMQISQDGTNPVQTANPLPVSATTAANTVTNPLFSQVSATNAANLVTNPIFTQISVDGTNAMGAANPLVVSDDTAANTIANPMYFQISADGTNPMSAANPLQVSATAAANLVTNPIFTQVSATNAANLVTNPIFTQLSQDGTNPVQTANPLPISATVAQNTVANPIFTQVSATNAANTLGNPMFFQISADGTNAVNTDAAFNLGAMISDAAGEVIALVATQADALATTTNSVPTSAMLYGYNGTNFDMLRVDGTNQLIVNEPDLRPGEDSGNDWRDIKKEEIASSAPIKTNTDTVDENPTNIFAALDILEQPNWCIYIHNNDGADDSTDLDIEVSPDSTTWIELTQSVCPDVLTSGTMCVYCVAGSAYHYLRVQATGNANPNEVDFEVHFTANKG
jgi:hypothetical protein